MNGSHVLWNLGSHREERRGEACCVYYQRCVPVLGCQWCAVTCIRLGRSVCRLERCAENTGMSLGECAMYVFIMLSVCLNVSNYYSKKPPLTGTALHHTRCACGAECAWECGGAARVASRTCDVVVEGGLVGIWGLGLLQQNEPIPHTLHSTLTLYTRRRQYQPHPRRARPSLATTRAP